MAASPVAISIASASLLTTWAAGRPALAGQVGAFISGNANSHFALPDHFRLSPVR
jgi:hypothetical protein